MFSWSRHAALCAVSTLVLTLFAHGQTAEFRLVDSADFDPAVAGGGPIWQYNHLRCVDERNCVAIVARPSSVEFESAAIKKSTNGGLSWSTVFFGHQDVGPGDDWQPYGVRIHDIATPTPSLWIAVADTVFGKYDYSGPTPRKVYKFRRFIMRTTDAGVSWHSRMVEDSSSSFRGITMFDATNGIAVAYDRIFATTDGGDTWEERVYPPLAAGSVKRILMFGPEHLRCFAYDNGSNLLSSTDGARTWSVEPLTMTAQSDRIDLITPEIGWQVGWTQSADQFYATGYVQKTTNGGRSWTTQWQEEQRRPTGLISIDFLDDRHGFVGGFDGEFMYTTDGGENWRRYDSMYRYDVPNLGEYPAIISIAAMNRTTALLGFSTTKLVRYSAAAASVQASPASVEMPTVAPNPARDRVTVSYPRELRGTVRVRDMLGRTLVEAAPNESERTQVSIDVSGLADGVYNITATDATTTHAARFVKRR